MTATYETVRYASLAGRCVVITGGATGIGAEMVRAFASQGARVAFLDIDHEAGAALMANVAESRFIVCDVTDIAALRTALERVEAKWPIDALVNNAANDHRHKLGEIEPDQWRHALSVNLDHQFFASQEVSRAMAARGHGSIVMMGSASWIRGRPGMAGYSTAKAAINGLTKTLARELGPSGIRVNCIVPGAVRTERQDKLWHTQAAHQRFIDDQALKFRLEPAHVARMALFLASDESAGCTGANFLVDAGLTQN
jgi:NAD(P)-dependent dehydrogenase (short-subunit alcohol dehydrogenase family)